MNLRRKFKHMAMKHLLLLFFFQFIAAFTFAQIQNCTTTCAAGLGENIFPDGDFGSGTAPLLATNPGFAPGYQFAGLVAPPNDGYFVITNNTINWGSFALDRWVNIRDNSGTQTGYMMVVNAAFSPGVFYEKKVSVCANTLYEMSVDVISMVEPVLASEHIQSDIAFAIDNTVVCATGNIPHDAKWHTFRFSFTTAPNQTSVDLSFLNNAPGGVGNDLAIDNISFRACGPTFNLVDTVIFCPDEPIELVANAQNSPYNTPQYLWQQRDNPNAPWQDLPNSNSGTLQVPEPDSGQQFRVVMANALANLGLSFCRVVSPPSTAVMDNVRNFAIGGPDTIVCNGAPALLEAGSHAQYQWSTGASTATINGPTPGWYAVTITSFNDCVANDSILVYQINLSASASATDPICFGDSTGTILVGNRMGGTGSLQYAPDMGWPGQSSPELEGVPAGDYRVQVTDSLGCTFEIPITLTNPPELLVNLGPDRSVLACETIVLPSEVTYPSLRYIWAPSDSLSCADCPVPLAMPSISQTYTVSVVNSANCVATDSIHITTLPRLEVYGPNIFLANSDGFNRFFTVFTSKSARLVKRFQIYDRWGNLHFSRQNELPNTDGLNWDGRSTADGRMHEGVYVWYALIEFSDGITREFSGDVLLLLNGE
jgi:CHU_C Type IX secretion signal domain